MLYYFFAYLGHASPNLNLGSNPVVAVAGNSDDTLFTAPSDQLIIISDVLLSAVGNNGLSNGCTSRVQITLSSGTVIGDFRLAADQYDAYSVGGQHTPSNILHSFRAGLPIPQSQSASISISGTCSVSYTISGFYAKP